MTIKLFKKLSNNYIKLLEIEMTLTFSYFQNELTNIDIGRNSINNIKRIHLNPNISIKQFEIFIKFGNFGQLGFSIHFYLTLATNELLFEELAKILETYLIESMAYWILSNITQLWNDLATKFMVPNYQVTSVIIPSRIILKQELLTMPTEILKCQRKEEYKCFKRGKFLKALELYKEILENCQHNAEALYKNTKLTSLNLHANYCGSEVGKILANVLCKNTTLTSLDLRVKVLADSLYKNTTLTFLNLGFTGLGSEGVYALANAFCKTTTLTSLNLKEGKALANALCKNTTLTSLNFSSIILDQKWKSTLQKTILTLLNLQTNDLEKEGGKAIADALFKNITLTSLNLCNNKLGLEGGKALANVLYMNTTLTSLNLQSRKEGVKALADALCKNTTLTFLNISNNKLESEEGGKAIANVLYKNTILTSLNLCNNNLGSEGGKALANIHYKNTMLTFLDLLYNFFGSEGRKALAGALYKNTILSSLNLYNNELGSEGEKALADALCKNTTLNSLYLSNNCGLKKQSFDNQYTISE
ncbi:hypothetical protein C2G38_2213938 [Gigaspora rosea]|uniref:Uncharacterized protein n=1 Tax=Gigaspora rosea TaxID=44941 RepID=A0A397UBR8_9GLOM|nr:hypothetical protein C2G38_2213938 [Gigaspora rosea]